MAHPVTNLVANIRDVDTLFKLHVEQTGGKRGRPRGVEVLNRSAIVLTTACWEACIEDIVRAGANFLGRGLPGPNALPECLQKRLCGQLREQKNELAVWALAGKGWRQSLVQYVTGHLERFNTPRTGNVDALVQRCLGLDQLSSSWTWRGMAAEDARKKLDEMVTLRGGIAHRVSAGNPVHKKDAQRYAEFIQRIAVQTSNSIRSYIRSLTGKYPWSELWIEKATTEGQAQAVQAGGR